MADKVLMTLGVLRPFDQVADALATLQPGQLLQIVADGRELTPELAEWCREHGHNLLDVSSASERLVVTIQKGS